MNQLEDIFGVITLGFIIAFVIQLYLLRNRINNIADPLLYFATTSAFALGLGLHAVDSVELYVRLVVYFCSFYAGFFVAVGRRCISTDPLIISVDLRIFKLIITIGCTITLVANLLLWYKSGLIILSDDPSINKGAAYADGFGIIRRINWGLGVFTLVGATYWYLWARTKSALLILGLAIFISVSGGGKSSLLPILFALGLYFLNPFLPVSGCKRIPSFRALLYIGLLATIPVVTVLLIENDSPASGFNALITRLFYYGDVLLYWGQSDLRAHFSKLSTMDYLRDSFGSILGMLRLIEYTPPIGNKFVKFTLSPGREFSDWLGPNLPFYVRGELFFGPWVAPIHAFVVGWILGRVRRFFLRYRGASLLNYTLAAFAVIISIGLPVEEGLAIGKIIDFLIIYFLIYILALMISPAVMPNRNLRFIGYTACNPTERSEQRINCLADCRITPLTKNNDLQ